MTGNLAVIAAGRPDQAPGFGDHRRAGGRWCRAGVGEQGFGQAQAAPGLLGDATGQASVHGDKVVTDAAILPGSARRTSRVLLFPGGAAQSSQDA